MIEIKKEVSLSVKDILEKYEVEISDFKSPLLSLLNLPTGNSIVLQGKIKNETKNSSGAHKSVDLTSLSSDSFESELDLTGCPLECPFDLNKSSYHDEDNDEKKSPTLSPNTNQKNLKYKPLDPSEARYLLNQYCRAALRKELPPNFLSVVVWVLCDGSDQQNTVYIGYHRGQSSCSRIIVNSTGPVLSKDDLPSLMDLKCEHQAKLSQNHLLTETSYFASYCLLSSSEFPNTASEGWMTLDCTWNKARHIFELPHGDVSCVLNVHPVSGDERSPAFTLHKELLKLQGLICGLQTGEVVWSPQEADHSLTDQLTLMIQGLQERGLRRKTENQHVPFDPTDFDSCLEAAVLGKRESLDFTDHLWTLLSGCSSFEELKMALLFIFKQLNSKEMRPLIFRKNTTTLGKYIRQIHHEDLETPSLEGVKPLEMLVEIGVEKLRRDYTSIFVGLELATQEQLQPFLQSSGNVVSALPELQKLHNVLEVIVLSKTFLQLPRQTLSSYTRESLKFYSTVLNVDSDHIFHFPIQISSVHQLLERLPVLEWRVSLKSRDKHYQVQNICQIATKPPFDHCLMCKSTGQELFNYVTKINCIQDTVRKT
ncbi:zwilch kinetochore protein isoform X2 [Tachypleus tridentatus]